MDREAAFRNVLEQMVRQELARMASESRELVRETVRSVLLPQLRTAVQDSINETIQELLQGDRPNPQDTIPAGRAAVSAPPCTTKEVKETMAVIREPEKKPATDPAATGANGTGRYVYCIADGGVAVDLGPIGLERSRVYTIPSGGMSAVVHDCSAQPYQSEDEQVVKGWVQTHQKVIDAAIQEFHTVLPLGFDTIIKGSEEADAERVVKEWLSNDSEKLREKMDRVRGKLEYGVQVFYDPRVIGETLDQQSPTLRALKEEMASQGPGMAYLSRHKLEKAVREEMEKAVEKHFTDFYAAIRPHADDVKIEKVKRDGDKKMLMNLSCLVPASKVDDLGNELERISKMDGFSVRFTGPWAPYSFV